jgi:hypothetical protein
MNDKSWEYIQVLFDVNSLPPDPEVERMSGVPSKSGLWYSVATSSIRVREKHIPTAEQAGHVDPYSG